MINLEVKEKKNSKKKHENQKEDVCKKCKLIFFNKYTLYFHCALTHDDDEHLCPKCFGVYARIKNHIIQCKEPLKKIKDKNERHKLILAKKKSKNQKKVLGCPNKFLKTKRKNYSNKNENELISDGIGYDSSEIKKNGVLENFPKHQKLVDETKLKFQEKDFLENNNSSKILEGDKCKENNNEIINQSQKKESEFLIQKNKINIEKIDDLLNCKKNENSKNIIPNFTCNNIIKNAKTFYPKKEIEICLENSEKKKELIKSEINNYYEKSNNNFQIIGDSNNNKKKITFDISKLKDDKVQNFSIEKINSNYKKIIGTVSKGEIMEKQNKNKFNEKGENIFNNKIHSDILDKIYLDYISLISRFQIIEIQNFFCFPKIVLGEGRFGKVHFGLKKIDFSPVAIKTIGKNKLEERVVSREAGINQILMETKIFGQIFSFTKDDNNFYIIEEIQGPSLDKFMNLNSDKDIITAYNLAIEFILNFKIIHEKGFLHIDTKEDNMASLFTQKIFEGQKLHFIFIDFGFSYGYKNNEGGHLDSVPQLKRCGNYLYASINALSGNPISRKDDLIQIIYMLISWCLSDIPWNKIVWKNDHDFKKEILKCKKTMNIKKLCENKIDEVNEIYDLINKLKFKDEPEYGKYIEILRNGITKRHKGKKNNFIWEQKIINAIKEVEKNKKDISENKIIKELFNGFPKEYILNFLNNNYGNFKGEK